MVQNIQEAFKTFDLDGDGTISVDELTTVLRQFGQTPTQEEVCTQLLPEPDYFSVVYCTRFL